MQVSSPARWGVLIYSSTSPDIEAAGRASFDAALNAAPVDGVAVAGWLGTASGTRQVDLTCDRTGKPADMSTPATLEAFLRWGMKAVPAEHYLVVLGGHGSGFAGAVMDPARSHLLSPRDMRDAFAAAGMHADVLVLNSCLGANAEVAAEVAPSADVLVASQGLQRGSGMPLDAVIAGLRADMKPTDAARVVVEASNTVPARTPLLSAVDTRRADEVVSSLDALGSALLDDARAADIARAHVAALPDYREMPGDHPLDELKDARAFAQRLMGDARLAGTSVAAAAAALDGALDASVVATTQTSGAREAQGLSVYLPGTPLSVDWVKDLYDGLTLSQTAPRWHAAVEMLGRPAEASANADDVLGMGVAI